MLILRLKQCERALADGRLDEAFDLVRQPDVRAHRRGQDLVGELVKALIDRGRRHLAQGRLTAAATDADKAIQLGGNLPDAVQLREAIGSGPAWAGKGQSAGGASRGTGPAARGPGPAYGRTGGSWPNRP